MGNSFGGWGAWRRVLFCESISDVRTRCAGARRAGARRAGVIRSPVVRSARCGQCDRVLGVVQIEARCPGVSVCHGGALMPAAGERELPARPTRPCTRPLRARDRGVFERRIQYDGHSDYGGRRVMGNPLGVNVNVNSKRADE